MITGLKRQLARRWPRAAAAYHALREPRPEADVADRMPDGYLFVGPSVMRRGDFELAETGIIRRLVRHRRVFIDVGANAGFFVCLARHFGCRVVAIEPLARNVELLYRNLVINGWSDVEVFPLGVASAPGVATLYGSGTGASLLARWAGASELVSQTIALSTLDVLVGSRFASDALLIKVDVEGAEYDVLRGATSLLHRSPRPAWLVELCLTENHSAGLNPHFGDVFDLFWRAGYEARPADALDRTVTALDVARWIAAGRRDFGYVNYLFVDPTTGASLNGGMP